MTCEKCGCPHSDFITMVDDEEGVFECDHCGHHYFAWAAPDLEEY